MEFHTGLMESCLGKDAGFNQIHPRLKAISPNRIWQE